MVAQFLLLATLLAACVRAQTLQKYIFSAEEQQEWGARCLDASGSGFYYVSASSPENQNKWVFNLEGGGFCLPSPTWPNVNDCFARAKTQLGSSVNWPATVSTGDPSSLLSSFNQVFIPYCSGDLHIGQRNESINGLYYAGHLTVVATIQKLLGGSFGLAKATDVIVYGESAGGIGVFVNIDYFQKVLPGALVVGMPNAGWFIPVVPYNPSCIGILETGLHLGNLTNGYVNQKCAAAYGTEAHRCVAGNTSYPFITAPLFIAQSIFDADQLVNEDGSGIDFSNASTNSYKIAFAAVMVETLQQVLASKTNGIYATASFVHVVPGSDTTNGFSLQNVTNNWLLQNKGVTQVMTSCTTPACQTIPTLAPSFHGSVAA